jgi:hypothetical protein
MTGGAQQPAQATPTEQLGLMPYGHCGPTGAHQLHAPEHGLLALEFSNRCYELGETILRITQWLLPLERS